jgi:hypothetical protein
MKIQQAKVEIFALAPRIAHDRWVGYIKSQLARSGITILLFLITSINFDWEIE